MSRNNRLKEAFKTCASCGGNILIPHLPCASLMAIASSSAIAAAYVSNIWLVGLTSVFAGAAGYISWRKSRLDIASKAEHGAMIAGSVLAASMMIGMHLPGMWHDHHNHHGHHQSEKQHYMIPAEELHEATEWYKQQTIERQLDIQKNAKQWNVPLNEAIWLSRSMCSSNNNEPKASL